MNKDNIISIGYYTIPGEVRSTIRLEDTKTYEREEFEVYNDELKETISKLEAMYPRHQTCQFMY